MPAEAHVALRQHAVRSHEVDRHVESEAAGEPPDLRHHVVGGGVERVVGAEGEGTLAGLGERVEREDRGGADHPGDLHGVDAEASDAPQADRLTGA